MPEHPPQLRGYTPPVPTSHVQHSLAPELMELLRTIMDRRAVSARLVVIRHRDLATRRPVTMPTNILSDEASLIPVEFDNLAGTAVSAPAGTATATNDNPAACVATVETDASGGIVLVLSPVQPPQMGAIVNVSVTDGAITTPTVDFVITADTNAKNAHLSTGAMSNRPLAP
jgi:hypothetical protein